MIEQRQLDILQHSQLVDQVEALEDEADGVLAQLGQPGFGIAGDILAVEPVFAGRRAVEHADNVEEGGLAAAGRPHHGHELARCGPPGSCRAAPWFPPRSVR